MTAVNHYTRAAMEKLTLRRLRTPYLIAEGVVLAGSLAGAAATSRAADWRPVGLVLLLGSLVFLGQRLEVAIRSQRVSGAFIALALAMTLLGPAPTVVMGLAASAYSSASRRISATDWLNNLAGYAAFPLAGGLLARALVTDIHHPHNRVAFALAVFAVFSVANALNFAVVAIDSRVLGERPLVSQVRELFIPLLPAQLAAGLLAAILAVAYSYLGFATLIGLIVVLLIFQTLTLALLRSEERADQLAARSTRLASLQLGVLTTLLETLALRDRMTARHVAAVARYARELAREAGCDTAEQDLAHTAGLLHDIGKFALPDHILHAKLLSDDDWAAVRRHPQEGATLVGRLDGYGPVAEIIRAHHERMDGSGYPSGLIGNEIPRLARIIAICEAFDAMTARTTYRSPMTPQDAVGELRRMAGRQFDPQLVEQFVIMIERDGPILAPDGDHANFDEELAFERRARAIAQPTRSS